MACGGVQLNWCAAPELLVGKAHEYNLAVQTALHTLIAMSAEE